jgi:hypothetical protein
MTNEDHNQIHDMMRDEMRSIRSDLHAISSKLDRIDEKFFHSLEEHKKDADGKLSKLTIIIVIMAGATGNLSAILKLIGG